MEELPSISVPGQLILLGVVGSTAYGLDTPESDRDYLGVYQAPLSALVGLHSPKESIVTNDPDCSIHEVGKFARLALKANPTILELLYLDDLLVSSRHGKILRDNRRLFLSQRVRKSYGGYVLSQAERLLKRGDGSFSSDTRKRTEKHGRHCARLLVQGTNLLKEATLSVRLTGSEAEYCWDMGELAATAPAAFYGAISEAVREFDSIRTRLPENPDEAKAHNLLLQIRGVL